MTGKKSLTFLYVFIFAFFIPILFFSIGLALDRAVMHPRFMKEPAFLFSGLFLFIPGWIIVLSAIYLLIKKGRGYPVSSLPPENLVVSGIYKFSRHPLYAGASLLFLGAALAAGSFWGAVLGWPAFTLFFISYARCIEEPVLSERFGSRYLEYIEETPLLFPYPGRRRVQKWAGALFACLSRCINRPLIFEFKGYYFFFGYAVWWAIGSFLSLMFLSLFLLRSGLTAKTIDLFELIFIPVTIIGSHIFWFGEARIETNINSSAFGSIAGFTSWGGLGGAVLAALAFAYGTGTSIFMWLDCIVPLLLMHFFGRIGCAFYGCCYGKPTGSNICLSYNHRALKAVREKFINPERLYPVQFFSALYGLVSFSLILVLEFYLPLERGLPIVLSLLLYGTFRFYEGWYRTQKRIFLSFFSIAQFAAMTLVITAAALLLFYFPNPAAPHYEPLKNLAIGAIINQLNFPVLIILSAFTAFSFGYHRREIGRWR